MTDGERADVGDEAPRGRTVITERALLRLAVAVVRDAAAVPARDVSVALRDDRGALRATVSVPVALGAGPGDPLLARGAALREAVVSGFHELAGRRVRAVDIRYSGIHRIVPRRVS